MFLHRCVAKISRISLKHRFRSFTVLAEMVIAFSHAKQMDDEFTVAYLIVGEN